MRLNTVLPHEVMTQIIHVLGQNGGVQEKTILNPYSSKLLLAQVQYMISDCTNFQKNYSQTVRGVCDTKLHEFGTYLGPSSRGDNSITGGAHDSKLCLVQLHYMTNYCTNFQKNSSKTRSWRHKIICI